MEHLLDALLTAFIPAAAVLLAAALYCLLPGRVTCKRKDRRALGWVLALFLAVSLLQLAGEFTLQCSAWLGGPGCVPCLRGRWGC